MKWLFGALVIFILWLLLLWAADPWVIVAGAIFSLLVAALVGRLFPAAWPKVLQPKRWLYFLIYLPYFLYYCIRANIDVALRVLHPDVPISPGIVKVRTTLQSDMAKTFLANSITLTPGTLTIDIDGQDFYVHWIYIPTDDPDERTRQICGRFERLLRRIFE